MALPAVVGAALSKARSMHGLASVLGGGSARRGGRRAGSFCLASCTGCVGCVLVAVLLALSIGGALVAATASLLGIPGTASCRDAAVTPCAALSVDVVGAPMNCPRLYVSQGFGNTPWEHPHTGIDIVCPPATMVVAVAAGVFHRARGAPIACSYPKDRTGGLGAYGVLDAGRRTYLYGHLEAFVAPDGADVTVGQPLGFEGASGCATGDHLHFEVLENGKPVNPCPFLPAGYPDPRDPTGSRCWGMAPP